MKTSAPAVCPIVQVAKLLSDTWTMLVLHALMDGEKRFCELEVELEHISTRTLTNKLKRLIDEGLIEKTTEGSYKVTKKGKGIKIIERAMARYGKEYLHVTA
jgi:DNA-binding HxlR family transcriptional regulator